ncbi:MAG: hypothetical protein K2K47_10875, partial [Duncaniella sp.]|nr:hypothetical protein [Duncaniella sp.]
MKLTFNVDYRTNWGESLYLTGSPDVLGNGDEALAVPMTLHGEQSWKVEVDIPATVRRFDYHYIFSHDDGTVRHEWGHPHVFTHNGNVHRA